MPLELLRWLVVAVVTYAAITLLHAASAGTAPKIAAAKADPTLS